MPIYWFNQKYESFPKSFAFFSKSDKTENFCVQKKVFGIIDIFSILNLQSFSFISKVSRKHSHISNILNDLRFKFGSSFFNPSRIHKKLFLCFDIYFVFVLSARVYGRKNILYSGCLRHYSSFSSHPKLDGTTKSFRKIVMLSTLLSITSLSLWIFLDRSIIVSSPFCILWRCLYLVLFTLESNGFENKLHNLNLT